MVIVTFCVALVGAFLISKAHAEKQPHMTTALGLLNKALVEKVGEGKIKHLDAAQAALETGTSDKGGHRVAAIKLIKEARNSISAKKMKEANKLIKQAIKQVKQGIKVDNKTLRK